MLFPYGFATGSLTGIMIFLAFVAAIVCAVLLYRRFVSDPKTTNTPRTPYDWGSFLRFDTLWVEAILKSLYLFFMCFVAFGAVATLLGMLFDGSVGAGEWIILLIAFAVIVVVAEIFLRLGFEQAMVMILIWKNTTQLRQKLVPESQQTRQPATSRSATPTPSVSHPAPAVPHQAPVSAQPHPVVSQTAPSAIQPTPVPQPSHQQSSFQESPAVPQTSSVSQSSGASQPNVTPWTCPNCGTKNKLGSFCSHCGTPRA